MEEEKYNVVMKKITFLIILVFVSSVIAFAFVMNSKNDNEFFDVEYQVMTGKELSSVLNMKSIDPKYENEFCYLVGYLKKKNILKSNVIVEIVFYNNRKNRICSTNLNWIGRGTYFFMALGYNNHEILRSDIQHLI